jgi:hypothetical protein
MGGARRLLRGHYNPVNWSRKYPNLQYAKVEGRRALICTSCMKTLARGPRKMSKATDVATAKI